MHQNRFTSNYEYSTDNPYLIAYWRLNTQNIGGEIANLEDYSQYNLSTTIDEDLAHNPRI
jgi:bisphosphoglycerate-independent phosphoglycerate mutase (AlkP superfamily)